MKYFVLCIFLTFFGCEHGDNKLNSLYGEFILSKFYYKNSCLSCNDFYYLYIDKNSNWLSIENQTKKENIKGKFKLYYNEKKEIYFDIFDSNDKKMNGNYLIEIDTIVKSQQRDELKITIQSNEVYIETYKNIVKKIGN